MHHMRRLVVRSILAAAFALAVPASGAAAVAPADTGLARTVSEVRSSDALSNALRYADSVAAADSIRQIAALLEATARRRSAPGRLPPPSSSMRGATRSIRCSSSGSSASRTRRSSRAPGRAPAHGE